MSPSEQVEEAYSTLDNYIYYSDNTNDSFYSSARTWSNYILLGAVVLIAIIISIILYKKKGLKQAIIAFVGIIGAGLLANRIMPYTYSTLYGSPAIEVDKHFDLPSFLDGESTDNDAKSNN